MPGRAATLLRFSHLVASTEDRNTVLSLLADASVDVVGVDAAVVLEVRDNASLAVAAMRNVPADLATFECDAETIGGELGEEVNAATKLHFGRVLVCPMVSGRDLFGALVLLMKDAGAPHPHGLELADGLAELVATLLSRDARVAELRRAHEELKTSQALLVRSERLRALGQMAAGIAHDLKNVLNPISLYLDVIGKAAASGDGAKVSRTVESIKGVLRTGTQTIERLRDFSRNQPETTQEIVDLNAVAHHALELARPRMSSTGAVSFLDAEFGTPPRVSARASDLVPAVLNLVVNAIDAMPKGGRITVRTAEVPGGALIEVEDNGPGMPKSVADQAFEPFFTTKGDAGTGLGLAMVSSCAQRYGGTVTLRTAPGEGTTVALRFPAPQGSGRPIDPLLVPAPR
jgi:signal transduction histidine kinase